MIWNMVNALSMRQRNECVSSYAICQRKKIETKNTRKRNRWAAIANPHAQVYLPPEHAEPHPWGMTQATH